MKLQIKKIFKLNIRNFFLDPEAYVFFSCGIAMFLTKVIDRKHVSVIPIMLYWKLLVASWVLFILKELCMGFRVAKELEKKEVIRNVLINYSLSIAILFLYFFVVFQYSATEPNGSIYQQAIVFSFIVVFLTFIFSLLSRKKDEGDR